MSVQRVAVLGASPKPDRASKQVVRRLRQHGHHVIPVHPVHYEIEGLLVARELTAIDGPVDPLTVYVGPRRGEAQVDRIVSLAPGWVIFNPGTEFNVGRVASARNTASRCARLHSGAAGQRSVRSVSAVAFLNEAGFLNEVAA